MNYQLDKNIDPANASELDISISLSDGDKSSPKYVTQRPHKVNHPNTSEHDQLMDFKEEMRKLMTFFNTSQTEKLSELSSILKDVQQTNQNIESAVCFLTTQNEEFKKQITKLENQVKEDRQYISYLEDKLEDLHIGNRKTNFEIKNVPRQENESKQELIEMVICLSETLDCKIMKNDIKDIYRVRGKKHEQKNTPIIVETNSALLRNDFLRMAKSFNIRNKSNICTKHLGLKLNEDTPIFLSEHLTAKGSRLYYLARDLRKSKGYKYCWTSYGKVFIRKSDQSPVILVTNEEQVHHLLLED